jgi:hypothetical protein
MRLRLSEEGFGSSRLRRQKKCNIVLGQHWRYLGTQCRCNLVLLAYQRPPRLYTSEFHSKQGEQMYICITDLRALPFSTRSGPSPSP